MKVNDIVELAKVSCITNLNIKNNTDAIVKFIYLGVCELYNRFNLSIKVEVVETNPDLALYELRNKDVSLLLSIYNTKGYELRTTDVIDASHYDYKLMNYKSFLLKYPHTDLLFAVYKASPEPLINTDDVIDLPISMIDALLSYVGYMSHSTINKDNTNESIVYYKKFNSVCQDLINQGYQIPLNTETYGAYVKGYK